MTKLVLRRKGATLYAPSPEWADIMADLPEHVDLNVNASKARSHPQLGTYFGLLAWVCENVEAASPWPTRHELSDFVQLEVGFVRHIAVASASPYKAVGRSWVDLDAGLFYRLPEGKKATKKRQPPAPIPAHLLAHMRRWKAKKIATSHFVEHNGAPVSEVTNGFAHAVTEAKLEGKVTPHTLRHTAATWLMQNGVEIWQAAGFLGMSEKVLRDTYGHHHPDFLKGAAAGFRPKK